MCRRLLNLLQFLQGAQMRNPRYLLAAVPTLFLALSAVAPALAVPPGCFGSAPTITGTLGDDSIDRDP